MSKECMCLHVNLEKLPIVMYPFDLNCLPENGIYFFYEKGEIWGHGGNKPRIVRIGTHKNENFRSRIQDHYLINRKVHISINKPKPSDRSIFRKNIGRAILSRNKDSYLKIWDIDFTSSNNRKTMGHMRDIEKERWLEDQITCLLQNNFFFRFIILDDEEKRMGAKGLESMLIGTVANCKKCNPSCLWLGNYSPKEQIRKSGLWLVQHVDSNGISGQDMLWIESLIDNTLAWIEERCETVEICEGFSVILACKNRALS